MSVSSPPRARLPLLSPDAVKAIVAVAAVRVREQERYRERLRVEAPTHASEQTSLAAFIPAVMSTDRGEPAVPPRHLREVVIPAVEDDALGNTVIIVPPGGAKTNTAIGACAWWLGRDPTQYIGYISNTAAQAYRRSVAVRDTIERSPQYHAIFPDVVPDRVKGWSESEWFLKRPDVSDKDASFTAAGVDGPILGARFKRGVLDDIADGKNMATQLQREKVIEWLQTTFRTRFVPGGRAVMICTRWHEKDPAAWAIEQGWHVVHIPAIDGEGESYWPERFPRETLACLEDRHSDAPRCCIKAGLGSRLFNLMYQGIVVDDEHALFKRSWWQRFKREDIAFRWRQSQLRGGLFVDTAQTVNDSSDYSVIATWLTDGARGYLWDVRRGHWTFPELMSQCIDAQDKAHGLPIYIEEVPWSLPLIQSLRTTNPGVIGWRIGQRVSSTERSKYARAAAASPFAEAGNLYLPYDAAWGPDFIEEHAAFPGGAHDDMVDTTSMFCLELLAGSPVRVGSYA